MCINLEFKKKDIIKIKIAKIILINWENVFIEIGNVGLAPNWKMNVSFELKKICMHGYDPLWPDSLVFYH